MTQRWLVAWNDEDGQQYSTFSDKSEAQCEVQCIVDAMRANALDNDGWFGEPEVLLCRIETFDWLQCVQEADEEEYEKEVYDLATEVITHD